MVVEINTFDNLLDNSWGQAIDTLKMIDRYGLQEEFMEHMEELFSDYCNEPYTDTQINDYIAYEFEVYDWIAEHMNIDDIDDLDELEEYAKDLCFDNVVSTIRDFTANNKEEILWNYIRNSCDHYSLKEVFDDLESLDELEEE